MYSFNLCVCVCKGVCTNVMLGVIYATIISIGSSNGWPLGEDYSHYNRTGRVHSIFEVMDRIAMLRTLRTGGWKPSGHAMQK